MRGVEQFTRETKLVKRVNEWENRIVPILEEQDKHEEFDLHKNRDEIIDELIYKHNLDFLHDNDEDAVREFARDLIDCIKNYIKTQ